MYKKFLITALALIGLITTVFSQIIDVYVVGTENGQAVVWKNNEAIYLTNDTTNAGANSVYVAGKDVNRRKNKEIVE